MTAADNMVCELTHIHEAERMKREKIMQNHFKDEKISDEDWCKAWTGFPKTSILSKEYMKFFFCIPFQ